MTTATAYQPKTLDELLARPCGCGQLAWHCAPPYGRIECAECGARLNRPCGYPAPAPQGGDGDDDGPDGGPAAPAPAARPRTLWLLIGGQAVARELSPDEEAELVEFVEACQTLTPDPEPCITCGRPASPYEATPAGRLCFRCWDPAPAPSPGPRHADPDHHRRHHRVAVLAR